MKLLHEFSLDFVRDGRPRMWTVLVGRDGLCKTSILRAIALAASGRVLTNQLAANHASSLADRREGASKLVRVRAEFDLDALLVAGQSRDLLGLTSETRRLTSELTPCRSLSPARA
jgi:recombinational DNA repair ATPase RecF